MRIDIVYHNPDTLFAELMGTGISMQKLSKILTDQKQSTGQNITNQNFKAKELLLAGIKSLIKIFKDSSSKRSAGVQFDIRKVTAFQDRGQIFVIKNIVMTAIEKTWLKNNIQSLAFSGIGSGNGVVNLGIDQNSFAGIEKNRFSTNVNKKRVASGDCNL